MRHREYAVTCVDRRCVTMPRVTLLTSMPLLALALHTSVHAADVQGRDANQSRTVRSEIASVDPATRTVTLIRADGSRTSIKMGPAVRRLEQMRPGDQFTVEYSTIRLVSAEIVEQVDRSWSETQEADRAPCESHPGSRLRRKVTFGATVEDLDADARSVTLITGQGTVVAVVSPSIDMGRIARGDHLQGRLEQLLTVSAEPKKAE